MASRSRTLKALKQKTRQIGVLFSFTHMVGTTMSPEILMRSMTGMCPVIARPGRACLSVLPPPHLSV